MSTESIREILFKVAKEFKTTDEDAIAEIDALIELYSDEVDSVALGSKNLDRGIAYYTAWSMKGTDIEDGETKSQVISEESHNESVKYANSSSTGKSSEKEFEIYMSNFYGKKYVSLLVNKNRPSLNKNMKKINYCDPVFDSI
jgi:hypothetical protein